MKGLRTLTVRLARRLERVSRKESMDDGGSDGWRCNICFDGWEGAESEEGQGGTDVSVAGSSSGSAATAQAGPSSAPATAGHGTGGDKAGLNDKTDIKALPCNHFFHKACLEPWFRTKHTWYVQLSQLRARNPGIPGATLS